MRIKICTPVVGKTLDEFLDNLKKTENVSDFVELRVDYIENLKPEDIGIMYEAKNKEAIFTCRPKNEGGRFAGSEIGRIGILNTVNDIDFEYIDIELETLKKNKIERNPKTKLIISYHNFQETPSYWDMQSIIYEMNKFQPDVIKIAAMLKEEYETTKIYRLLTNKPHNEERIVIGMGEKGKMTRVLGPLLGSYLTYASTEWGESAPGQMTIEEMENIYHTLSSQS